jgi:hypothetical protein
MKMPETLNLYLQIAQMIRYLHIIPLKKINLMMNVAVKVLFLIPVRHRMNLMDIVIMDGIY